MTDLSILQELQKQELNLVAIPHGQGKRLNKPWLKYQTEKCSEPLDSKYDYAVICGETSENLVVFDFDHTADESILNEIVENALSQTLVVKSGNGFHLYVKMLDNLIHSFNMKTPDGRTIEVKGQGTYVVSPSSDHYNTINGKYEKSGKTYKIISKTSTIMKLNGRELFDKLKNKGYTKVDSQQTSIKTLWKPDYKKTTGENRHQDVMRVMESFYSYLVKQTDLDKELIDKSVKEVGLTYNSHHFDPPLDEEEVTGHQFDSARKFIDKHSNSDSISDEKIKEKLGTKTQIQFIEDYLRTKVKDDDKLIRHLLRTCFSKDTTDPINLGILAQSSSGKTHAAVSVTELFPKEDVISVGRLSPTALIHQTGTLVDENFIPITAKIQKLLEEQKTSNKDRKKEISSEIAKIKSKAKNLVTLSGKILLFLDNPDPRTWEVLKPILSHDKKQIEYNTTKGDGTLEVKKSIIEGFPAVIFCSAKNEAANEVWTEISNRCFLTTTNDTSKKYKAANQLTGKKLGIPSICKTLYHSDENEKISKQVVQEIVKNIQEECMHDNQPVYNMFADEISNDLFPHNEGEHMRHFKRFLEFCNIEALIDESSPRLNFESNTIVLVTPEHIKRVTQMFERVSTIPPTTLEFYNKVFKPAEESKLDGMLDTNDLMSRYKETYPDKTISPKKLLDNFIYPSVSIGLIEKHKNPSNFNLNLYQSSTALNENNLANLPDKLEEKIIFSGKEIASRNYKNPIEPSEAIYLYIHSRLKILLESSDEKLSNNTGFNLNHLTNGFSIKFQNSLPIGFDEFMRRYDETNAVPRVQLSSVMGNVR